MIQDRYVLYYGLNEGFYEFYSEGPNGEIKKTITYTLIGGEIYNLAFGDWGGEKRRINDTAKSNNGDRDKILSTVAFSVIDFMRTHPQAKIVAEGSTPARTRLYQMGITNNWLKISILFNVWGYFDDDWQPFKPGRNFDAFLLSSR